jgi:uncharacterized phiE125 gp8 family phage protein
MRLIKITDATIEPVTVAEVKLHTHISHAVEDALLADLITAGRQAIELYQNRAWLEQTFELQFDDFPCKPFDVPRPPLVSVESLKYLTTDGILNTYDITNLLIDTKGTPGRVSLKDTASWPIANLETIGAVRMEYTAGYSTADEVPASVKHAIYVYVGWAVANRAAEQPLPVAFFDLLRPMRVNNV